MNYDKIANGVCQYLKEEIIPQVASSDLTRGIAAGFLNMNRRTIRAYIEKAPLESLGITDTASLKLFFDGMFEATPVAKISPKTMLQKVTGLALENPLIDTYLGGTLNFTREDAEKFLSYLE